LALREFIFAVIFNDVAHFVDLDGCIYKIQTKKEVSGSAVNRHGRDPLAASPNPR
jgi:hypothetical protein